MTNVERWGWLLWPSEVTVPTGELLLRLCVVKREAIEVDVAGALGVGGENTVSCSAVKWWLWARELWCPSCSMLILSFILSIFQVSEKKSTNPVDYILGLFHKLLWNFILIVAHLHIQCFIEGKVLSLKKHTKKSSLEVNLPFLALLTFNHTVATWLIVVNKLSK